MKMKRPVGQVARAPFQYELDTEWQARMGEKNRLTLEQHPELAGLVERLLSVDGCVVCLQPEPDLAAILARGCAWGGKAKSMPGQPSHCHRNSARCWEANEDRCRVATGYALSSDGMWRQHSWIVVPRGRRTLATADPTVPAHWSLVETTVPRLAYYGLVMTEKECSAFAWEND